MTDVEASLPLWSKAIFCLLATGQCYWERPWQAGNEDILYLI